MVASRPISIRRTVQDVVLAFILFTVAGCTTPSALDVGTTAPSRSAISYEKSPFGVLMVPVQINDAPPMQFVIDTAATISVINRSVAEQLGLAQSSDETRVVRGLIESAQRPMTESVNLTIVGAESFAIQLAILDTPMAGDAVGIIGLDVLKSAAILVDPEDPVLRIFWNGSFDARQYADWDVLRLRENTKIGAEYGLHFTDTKFGNKRVLTLLDTGAEFSAMNWKAGEKIKELRTHRQTLRDKWVVAGAIGEFKPRAMVRIGRFSMGEHLWESPRFLVFDFEALDVIGANERPLIIAGAPLFMDRRYAIDLHRNRIYIDPATGPDLPRGPTVRFIPSNEGGRIQRPD